MFDVAWTCVFSQTSKDDVILALFIVTIITKHMALCFVLSMFRCYQLSSSHHFHHPP